MNVIILLLLEATLESILSNINFDPTHVLSRHSIVCPVRLPAPRSIPIRHIYGIL